MTEPKCTVPPAGWTCTRKAGHDGPCAAIATLHPLDAAARRDVNDFARYEIAGFRLWCLDGCPERIRSQERKRRLWDDMDESERESWRQKALRYTQPEPLPSRDAPVSDTALLDLLEARGVVSIYFADGSQLNAGSLSARAAIACLRVLHTEASHAEH